MITLPLKPAHRPVVRATRALILAACVVLPVGVAQAQTPCPDPMVQVQWAPTVDQVNAPLNAQPTPASMPMSYTPDAPYPAPRHRWYDVFRPSGGEPTCFDTVSVCSSESLFGR